MPGLNDELADHLAEVAALLRASKADRFRVRAYERAARTVRAAPVDLATLDDAEVRRLAGIGSAISGIIAEFRDTGTTRLLEQLREAEPVGVGALLQLPLIGLRDARTLADRGFADIATLQDAAETPGGLARLEDRLRGRVRESLRRWARNVGPNAVLSVARRDAEAAARSLCDAEAVDDVLVAGDVRRGVDIVERIDLVVVAGDPAAARSATLASPTIVRVLDDRVDRADVMLSSGRPATVRFAPPEGVGPALVLATGSAAHVEEVTRRAAARGLTYGGGGLFALKATTSGSDERAVYDAIGLPWIPPEIREGDGEVVAAERGQLPDLVTAGDLHGDLHVHSDWSRDGKATLDDMVAAASARGYGYVAITDHAENLRINGMSRDTVLARREAIAQLQEQHPEIRILDAAELNIDLVGGIDYDLDFLLEFDLGVASIHSHMDRDITAQTDRILGAMQHPVVNVIGHPTGRIIGHRPGYGIEMEAIAQGAAETGTALEVNGSARRLDLSGEMARIAVRAGALVSLSSDAHSVVELATVGNAVTTARRGWATPVDVLNARPLDDLLALVARKRARMS